MNTKINSVVATRKNLNGMKNKIAMQLPNPDYVLNKLGNRIEILRELLYDSHVSSCVQSRKSGVLSHEYDISDSGDDTQILNIIQDIISKFNMPKIISEILESPLYGYKVLEILWRLENNLIVPVDIIGRPSEWFFFDDSNMCRFRSANNMNGVILSPNKFLLVQNNASYINPYGESILSKCYWPVFFKKEATKNWSTFCEKYGMPHLWATAPFGASVDVISDLADSLEELRQDGIIVTEGDEIKVNMLDGTKSSSPDLYLNFINHHNSEISKAILSQTLTTEIQDRGSYSASQTHYQVRQDILDADKRVVEQCFNQLIKLFAELNFPSIVNLPKFSLYQEQNVDMNLAQRDQALASTNQIKFSKEYFKRKYGFKDDEIEISEPAVTPAFAETENTKDDGFDKFTSAVEPIVKQVMDLINNGNSFKEIQDTVINLYPELNTDEIESHIAQAIMLSNASGQFSLGK